MTPAEARDVIWKAIGGQPYQSGRWLLPLSRYKSESACKFMGRFNLERYGYAFSEHPIRPSLDLLAALWAEYAKGWTWARWGDGEWIAQNRNNTAQMIETIDTGNEVDDRTVLLALVMEASK